MRHSNTIGAGFFLLLLLVAGIPVSAANETCTISVLSIPQGAAVYIDRTYAGTTPLADLPIPDGVHNISVSKEGYSDYTSFISSKPGTHQDIIANLQKLANRGLVKIRTIPSGGNLYIDGRYQDNTLNPVIVENLVVGRHEILIRKSGYEDYRSVISVTAGELIEYTEYLTPLPDTGFLSITSNPDASEVFIDGIPAGKTPTKLQRIIAGNHTVTLTKAGYWNFTGILTIRGGESTTAKADLSIIPTASTLYIDSSPRGMGFYINGTFKGETPSTFENLPSGDYQIEFRNHKGTVNQSFRFLPGATYEVYTYITEGAENSIRSTEWRYQNQSSQRAQPGWTQVNATQAIERTFTWNSNGHIATITLDIPRELYEYYRSQPHPVAKDTGTLSGYAISEQDRQYLHELVYMLKDASSFKSYAARNDYRNVVAFVQSIAYADDRDPATGQLTEYWKYPVETLADGNGDCEDTAILTAALLREMGYDVAVVFLPEHAAVAVTCETCNGYYYPLDGKKYYYLETTGTGLSLGSMGTGESTYKNAVATIVPL